MASPGLAARSISAVLWGAGGALLRMVLQVGAQITMARALGPAEYGVFAIGLLTVTFSMFFADFGLSSQLIQKPTVSDEDVRFIFTCQVMIGAAVTAFIVLTAELIAEFFAEPRASDVVKALAPLCLINAMASPANNILRRHLRQKALQLSALVSYVVGFVVVGVPMALVTHSVWSLVVAWLVQATLAALMAYCFTRHPVRPLWWHPGARSQSAFGGVVFITNLVNWFVTNTDRIVIGRLLPTQEIGLYNQAYSLYYAPVGSVMGVVYPVFLSSAARVSDATGKQDLRDMYLALTAGIVFFALPVLAGASAVSDTIFLTLFGHAWAASAPLASPIALSMVPLMLYGITTPLVWVAGRKTDELLSQLPLAIFWGLVAVLLGKWFGAIGVAWGLLVFVMLRLAAVTRPALRAVNLHARDVLAAMRGGVVVSMVCAAGLALLQHALVNVPAPPRLALLVLVSVALFLVQVRLLPALIHPALRRLLVKAVSHAPARVGAVARTCGIGR